MTHQEVLQTLLESKIVAIVRTAHSAELLAVARALFDGGIRAIEVTFTVPHAVQVLEELAREMGQAIVLGAGTVLDAETARQAILAGAQFIVAPNTRADVIQLCRRYSRVVIPGAWTPTEVMHAWEQGADIVKIFPAEVGGPGYIRALLAPLPQIRLMPTGGVNLQTAADFLRAGACCLGIGSQLVEPRAIAERNYARLTELARQYVAIVRQFTTNPPPTTSAH